MNKIAKLFLGIGLASSFGACLLISNLSFELKDQSSLFEKEMERRSITFLLGEDKPGYQYFRLAEEHFLHDPEEQTDKVINSCRSLEDIIEYLNTDQQQAKWAAIQVVLHGNPWQGLSLPIVNDGPRATKRELAKALLKNPLPKLTAASIDTATRINFWGCGIGKNPFINIALDTFFKLPNGQLPEIYTSPHFVVFKEVANGPAPKRIKASYWPYIFKRGYRPSAALISSELKKQHPDVVLDWDQAISNSAEQESVYNNSFHLPVSWTVVYPSKEARPSVTTEAEQMAWVHSQEELVSQLEEMGIPINKYTWTIGKRIITQEDGKKVPAIKAVGMATVLCILEESS